MYWKNVHRMGCIDVNESSVVAAKVFTVTNFSGPGTTYKVDSIRKALDLEHMTNVIALKQTYHHYYLKVP